MKKIINFHSHDTKAPIISLRPEEYIEYEPKEGQLLTVGIHPWDTEEDQLDAFDIVAHALANPKVIGLGEVGVDTLHGSDLDRQLYILRAQLKYAVSASIPVIFHVVRRYDIIIALHREFKPDKPWAVHAFRGKPEAVRQLAREGIYMSIGHNFNIESVREIPEDLLLLETDDLPNTEIQTIVGAVAAARSTSAAEIERIVTRNLARFYGL